MEENKIILTTLSPNTHRTSEENLGLGYLKSSLVNKGYKVDIIDGWLNELSVKEVYEKIIQEKDKILFVGISSYMSNTLPTIQLIKMLKETSKDIKIICGGFGPTFYPKEYLENGSDFIIRGEGEKPICLLADSIEHNTEPQNINNIGYLKDDQVILNSMDNLLEDLDSLPFPSRDTLNTVIEKKSTVNMVTARGCSGNCGFCSVIPFFRLANGKIWRSRSIKNIVDEIEKLYLQGVSHIKMVDDSFIDGSRDEKWCKEFADEIERRNIDVRLRGQIRADKITDSILYDLKRAGFFSFACGIENGSQTALSRMNKKATLEDNRNALELLKKYNYIVQMGFILFDKDTTLQELEENYVFLKEYDFTVTKGIFSEMFSAEGTSLNTSLRDNGDLIEGNFITNNNKYTIDNENVSKVYSSLKTWHKSHSEIYDMTIDPLSAPKSIDAGEMQEFYEYAMRLKVQDLKVFKELLISVKNETSNLTDYVENMIKKTVPDYENISSGVAKLYKKNSLTYSAAKNPFI